VIGLVSAIYKQFFFTLFVKPFEYTVVKTETVNEILMKITLHAKNKIISFLPGQYAFIHFEEPNFSKEQHPFTLSRKDGENELFIYVKNRGDYTKALLESLQSNWTAFLEGPYGRLDFRPHQKQIWIAGGIGIALFLSWLHSLKSNHGKTIDLFFCCHNRADLVALKEFEVFNQGVSGIEIFTFCSEDGKRLNSTDIIKACSDYRDRKIFMCGPRKLTSDMRKQLIALSINKNDIEYEDFNFF
jgi:predicted ferric reductase